MKTLKVEVQKFGNTWIYHFFGYLNEDAKIPLLDDSQVSDIQLNLEKLSRINSVGIRTWFKFTKSIGPQVSVQLSQVPKILILQANTVSGFFPKNSRIQTFEVPFICENCDVSESLYFTPEQTQKGAITPPKCRKCKADMELDAIADMYFRFLDSLGK
jgi:hypothetical protein